MQLYEQEPGYKLTYSDLYWKRGLCQSVRVNFKDLAQIRPNSEYFFR
jgi:hypothetical protein